MNLRPWKVAAGATVAALSLSAFACQNAQAPPPNSAGEVSAGTSGGTTGTGTGSGTSIPTLVSVNLQNVLNDLSVSLQVNRDNIPVNAQVPIDVAANVCGVAVNVLAASIASGQGGCTATTTSPTLVQYVQQQLSAGSGTQTTTGTTTNNMM